MATRVRLCAVAHEMPFFATASTGIVKVARTRLLISATILIIVPREALLPEPTCGVPVAALILAISSSSGATNVKRWHLLIHLLLSYVW